MTFAAMPGVPTQGLTDAEFRILTAIKQNIDLLTGQSANPAFRAVVSGQITVSTLGPLSATNVSLSGQAASVGGQVVPIASDFTALATTTQQLVNDMQLMRATLNSLIAQLGGS